MKNTSSKKLSILGLVLMGASAVTATILPSIPLATRAETPDDGTLRQWAGETTDGKPTCMTRSGAQSCNKSNLPGQSTNTSVPSNASSMRNGQTTQNQTSNSAAHYHSSVEVDI